MDIICTQCGGNVPIEIDQGLATCPFCSSSLFISMRGGYVHYILSPVVKNTEVQKFLNTHLDRLERRGNFTVTETRKVFWPYWQFQSEDRFVTHIASTNPITALEEFGVPTGDSKPFVASQMENEVVEQPGETLEDIATREGYTPTKVRLVHAPFWIVGYKYDRIDYEAWIDAVGGRVFADELPPTFEKQKDKLYALTAFAIFAAFLLLGLFIRNGNYALIAYAGASAPMYFGAKQYLKGVMS